MMKEFVNFFDKFKVREVDSKKLFLDLSGKYSENGRHYHNLTHISDMLAGLHSIKDKVKDYSAVFLATWFHDAKYHTQLSNNEEESADIAAVELQKLRLPPDIIKSTCEMVLSTKYHVPYPNTEDCRYMLDLDLSILGADEIKYKQYSDDIRKEYSWVPENDYRQGRSGVLKKFLAKETIYYTDFFKEKLEKQARRNLLGELEGLS